MKGFFFFFFLFFFAVWGFFCAEHIFTILPRKVSGGNKKKKALRLTFSHYFRQQMEYKLGGFFLHTYRGTSVEKQTALCASAFKRCALTSVSGHAGHIRGHMLWNTCIFSAFRHLIWIFALTSSPFGILRLSFMQITSARVRLTHAPFSALRSVWWSIDIPECN